MTSLDRIRTATAEALAAEDARNWGYDHDFVPTYGQDAETDGFVNATIAAVLHAAADELAAPVPPAAAGPWTEQERGQMGAVADLRRIADAAREGAGS